MAILAISSHSDPMADRVLIVDASVEGAAEVVTALRRAGFEAECAGTAAARARML